MQQTSNRREKLIRGKTFQFLSKAQEMNEKNLDAHVSQKLKGTVVRSYFLTHSCGGAWQNYPEITKNTLD